MEIITVIEVKQIAFEIESTAKGYAYYGNALYVAKGIPGLSKDDTALLDTWLRGARYDSWRDLQALSNKIAAMEAQ